MMIVFIPENIDVSSVVKFNQEANTTLSIDKMSVILYEIVRAEENEKGFGEIPSKKIQYYVHDYRPYLDALYAQGIIVVDRQFQYGIDIPSKVRGYKFSEAYNTTVKEVEITNLPLIKKYRKKEKTPKNNSSVLHYLKKSFNDKLTIDKEAAIASIQEEKEHKMSSWEVESAEKKRIKKMWFSDYQEKLHLLSFFKMKDPIRRYNHAYIGINRLSRGEHYFFRDNTSQRVHTNLTRLQRSVRNFITYDGQTLVSIDIKSSQPYFSLLLLNKYFYHNTTIYNRSAFTLPAIPHIILEETLQNINNKEIKLYSDLITSGGFYEYFQVELVKRENSYSTYSRSEIKEQVFRILYSQNQYLNQQGAFPKRVFQELFPGIYDLHAELKKVARNFLPVLLQRIESYAIIDVIAPKLSRTSRGPPIYTIHDSIITTEDFSEVSQRIIKQELIRIVGYEPKLSIEKWHSR